MQREIESLPEAVVVVITKEKKVLLIQRGPDVPDAGYWAPLSGKIEPQEDQAGAVVREVREEAGLTVRPVRKVWENTAASGSHKLHWWLAEWVSGDPDLTHERLLTPAGLAWTKFFALREPSMAIVSSSKACSRFSDTPSNQRIAGHRLALLQLVISRMSGRQARTRRQFHWLAYVARKSGSTARWFPTTRPRSTS